MPRGVKGSGPYSKLNPDGSPKVKGEVQNDLAAPLKGESATDKASTSTTVTAKKSTAAAKRPARKAPAKAAAAPASNGNGHSNGNGNGRVQTVTAITIDAAGEIQFVGESGGIQKLQLADPTYLLKLESKVKEATDQYVRDLAASRS